MSLENSFRQRLEALEKQIEIIDRRESFALKVLSTSLGSFLIAFIAALGGSAYISQINERQIMTAVSSEASSQKEIIQTASQDMERRVTDAIMQLQSSGVPDEISIENVLGQNSNYIIGRVSFYASRANTNITNYIVEVDIPYRIKVSSEIPAKILGVNIRFSEELPAALHEDIKEPAKSNFIAHLSAPLYDPFGSEGIILSPQANATSEYSLRRAFLDCQSARSLHDGLTRSNTVGQVFLMPVSEVQPRTQQAEQRFFLNFVSSQQQTCEQITAALENDNAED